MNCEHNTVLIIVANLISLAVLFFMVLRARLILEQRITALESYVKILMRNLRLNPHLMRPQDQYREDFDNESG